MTAAIRRARAGHDLASPASADVKQGRAQPEASAATGASPSPATNQLIAVGAHHGGSGGGQLALVLPSG